MVNLPLVTIGLPVYNGEQWINQAIDSLIDQDYENIEIVIADDQSTDNTAKICKKYSKIYDNVIFNINKENLGGQGNLFHILEKCSSEYFVWGSQDDFWKNNYVSSLVKKLEKDKDMVLASGNIEMINMDGSSYIINFAGKWDPEKLNQYQLITSLLLPVDYGKWIKNNLFLHGVIRTSSLKKCFEVFPGVAGHDRSFILFLILQGGWGYVDEVLYHRRTGVGELIRKAAPNDKINKLGQNKLLPFISAKQMLVGLSGMLSINFSIKLYCFVIIVAYVISLYLVQMKRVLFGVNFLKRMLPIKWYNFIREIKNNQIKHG
jgi:glycosyltransferase involved in cell wall biosynthesis